MSNAIVYIDISEVREGALDELKAGLKDLADFVEAMGFVTRVALVAEKAFHHPDIDIRWNKVTLRLSTHSEGGLTEKDLELAERVDGLA